MSNKAQAAYHGRDIVDRLRAAAYTEDGPALREAANEIERLRDGIDAVLEGHASTTEHFGRQLGRDPLCRACGTVYPCPTVSVLTRTKS